MSLVTTARLTLVAPAPGTARRPARSCRCRPGRRCRSAAPAAPRRAARGRRSVVRPCVVVSVVRGQDAKRRTSAREMVFGQQVEGRRRVGGQQVAGRPRPPAASAAATRRRSAASRASMAGAPRSGRGRAAGPPRWPARRTAGSAATRAASVGVAPGRRRRRPEHERVMRRRSGAQGHGVAGSGAGRPTGAARSSARPCCRDAARMRRGRRPRVELGVQQPPVICGRGHGSSAHARQCPVQTPRLVRRTATEPAGGGGERGRDPGRRAQPARQERLQAGQVGDQAGCRSPPPARRSGRAPRPGDRESSSEQQRACSVGHQNRK